MADLDEENLEAAVIADLDGTLQEGYIGGIPETTVTYFEGLRTHRTGWTIATGRTLGSIHVAIDRTQVWPRLPIVVENGGSVLAPDGRVLYAWPLGPDIVRAVAELAHLPCVHAVSAAPRMGEPYLTFGRDVPTLQVWAQQFGKVLGDVLGDVEAWLERVVGPTKIDLIPVEGPGHYEATGEALARVPDAFGSKTGGRFVVHDPKTDKGIGALRVMNLLGLQPSRIVVAGNDENDIALFREEFGARIAVGNCPTSLRERATHHCASPAELPRTIEAALGSLS